VKRALGIALVLALAGALLAAGLVWNAWHTPYRGYADEAVFVEIPRGMASAGIAHVLADRGVVRNRLVFELLCRFRSGARLQAGEYRFDRALTPDEVFGMIAEGRVYVHSITIPEGWTMFEVADLLEKEGFGKRQEFLSVAEKADLLRDLAPRARSLEGFLFPATYQFPRRATAATIAEAMVAHFRQVWGRLARENAGELTPSEIVTLASLVEREARVAEERPLIAGVYMNRLKKGMALQCDPTVIYALELAGKWDGKIGHADLRFASPYNTYVNRGLPPGPIANPGEASLRAALHPSETRFLYFVADTLGRHFFSETLEEHSRNVRRYLRLLDDNGASHPASAALGAAKAGKRK